MSDNLPENWEPYVIQPSHGFLFWLSVILLVAVLFVVCWSQLRGALGAQAQEAHHNCTPLFYNSRPVDVCERN